MGNTVWIIVGAVVVVVLGIWLFMSGGDGTATAPDAPATMEAPATEAPAAEEPVSGN